MGIRKLTVVAHEWEPYYKDEFRRAARLARELAIAIEPYLMMMNRLMEPAPQFDKPEEL